VVQSFPNILVAGPLGFHEEESYADDVAALSAVPKVSFGEGR